MASSPNGKLGFTSSHFDDEARALFKRLQVSPTGNSSPYNPLDPVYKHPETGAIIYVGNQQAASDSRILSSKGITHVVNCTNGLGQIQNFHEGSLKYYRFPVSDWRRHVDPRVAKTVKAFTMPLFDFIDGALSKGQSVLVHCLAGAHRAGTTGTLCLMHYCGMDTKTAIATAKKLRPIIDPICDFPNFLHAAENAGV